MDTSLGGRRWLPVGFRHPVRVELTTGHHLRPIRESDVDLDYPAVMGAQASLWARYGEAWGWPPPTMTYEHDRADLARHEREMVTGESFNSAVFDADETALLGCVYLDPPEAEVDADLQVSWWLVDDLAGSALDAELATFVPQWVVTAWPFSRPAFGP